MTWVEGVIGLVTYVVRSHGQWGREYRHRDRETAQMIPPRHVEMEGMNVDQVTIVCYRVAQQSVRGQLPRGRLAREQRNAGGGAHWRPRHTEPIALVTRAKKVARERG